MDAPLPTGKLPEALLAEVLDALPALPPELRVGPRPGEDACAIDLPGGTLVVATDPVTLTGAEVGALAVVINANDVAVMGVRPRWFLASVLFPAGTRAGEVRALFAGLRGALERAQVALVGGHTEITPVVSQTVVVGQMLGLGEPGAIVTTGGTRPGDAVLQIGPAPVEGAAVLAQEGGPRLARAVAPESLEAARRALDTPGLSVVEAALLAASLGASALHDPTEGGLATGLWELASTAGLRIELDEAAVLWFEPGVELCRAVGADPWGTLASGTLLASVPAAGSEDALVQLRAHGYAAARIGTAREGPPELQRADGTSLPHFERDELARVL